MQKDELYETIERFAALDSAVTNVHVVANATHTLLVATRSNGAPISQVLTRHRTQRAAEYRASVLHRWVEEQDVLPARINAERLVRVLYDAISHNSLLEIPPVTRKLIYQVLRYAR